MGVYDTVGENQIQIKLFDSSLHHFDIGDKIETQDGLYIGWEGWFVVEEGIIVKEGETILDKWGNLLDCGEIIKGKSEVLKIVKETIHKKNL